MSGQEEKYTSYDLDNIVLIDLAHVELYDVLRQACKEGRKKLIEELVTEFEIVFSSSKNLQIVVDEVKKAQDEDTKKKKIDVMMTVYKYDPHRLFELSDNDILECFVKNNLLKDTDGNITQQLLYHKKIFAAKEL
jgi:hypothetical protein